MEEHMIWLAVCVAAYSVMGLCLLALCRAAAIADGQRERRAVELPELAVAS
jgi:hypothetical protein